MTTYGLVFHRLSLKQYITGNSFPQLKESDIHYIIFILYDILAFVQILVRVYLICR